MHLTFYVAVNNASLVDMLHSLGNLFRHITDSIPILSSNILLVNQMLQTHRACLHHHTVWVLLVTLQDRILPKRHVLLVLSVSVIATQTVEDVTAIKLAYRSNAQFSIELISVFHEFHSNRSTTVIAIHSDTLIINMIRREVCVVQCDKYRASVSDSNKPAILKSRLHIKPSSIIRYGILGNC